MSFSPVVPKANYMPVPQYFAGIEHQPTVLRQGREAMSFLFSGILSKYLPNWPINDFRFYNRKIEFVIRPGCTSLVSDVSSWRYGISKMLAWNILFSTARSLDRKGVYLLHRNLIPIFMHAWVSSGGKEGTALGNGDKKALAR